VSSTHGTESYLSFLERSAERGRHERETIVRAIGSAVRVTERIIDSLLQLAKDGQANEAEIRSQAARAFHGGLP